MRHDRFQARRNIYRANEKLEFIGVVRNGWAFQFVLLPDGRRQILSIILPGDMLTIQAVGRSRMHYSVQSLTDAEVCFFGRTEFVDAVLGSLRARDRYFNLACDDREDADQRVVDLGRCSAEERLARFLLSLMRRMSQRGLSLEEESFPLPLKQHHLADALGLTPVHVSRTLNKFRKEGLLEWSGGNIRITDAARLTEVAGFSVRLRD